MPYIYPTAQKLREIEQERMPVLMANRVIFDIMPIVTEPTSLVRWEQADNYIGLQQVRGLGGEPSRVRRPGGRTFIMDPGVYGEFITIDEVELTQRRPFGSVDAPIDITDLVVKATEQLQQRFLDRIEVIGWAALQGTISVSSPLGVLHSDTFPVQSGIAPISWTGDPANSVPVADFRTWKLLGRGRGASFGRGAKAYMNSVTANALLANRNLADLHGMRNVSTGTVTGIDEVNRFFVAADLPEIVEYDGGYLDEVGVWQNFIPGNRVIIVGTRNSGTVIADYAMTLNANNEGLAAGQYTKVVDRGEHEVPRSIEVHNGHNGGPRIYYPGSVIVASV